MGRFDHNLSFRHAKNIDEMREVWRITHDQYVAEGYADKKPDGMLRHYSHLDLSPQTNVYVAEDMDRNIVGTISMTVDSSLGLPVDEDFPDIMNKVRFDYKENNYRLAACWRLATVPEYRGNLDVIMKLLTIIYDNVFTLNIDLLLLTVNPKHVGFYQRMCGIVPMSECREASAVKGAPAVLMGGTREALKKNWREVKRRRTSARLTRGVA